MVAELALGHGDVVDAQPDLGVVGPEAGALDFGGTTPRGDGLVVVLQSVLHPGEVGEQGRQREMLGPQRGLENADGALEGGAGTLVVAEPVVGDGHVGPGLAHVGVLGAERVFEERGGLLEGLRRLLDAPRPEVHLAEITEGSPPGDAAGGGLLPVGQGGLDVFGCLFVVPAGIGQVALHAMEASEGARRVAQALELGLGQGGPAVGALELVALAAVYEHELERQLHHQAVHALGFGGP